ncbi:hypothetical protein CR513_53650, partial [Mucuna pruriens]
MRRSMVLSSGFSPVTVKYLRCTVSLYSDDICCLKLLKLSIESFSFFLSPFTTDVLVRSEDEPGPEPDKLRLASFERSNASSRTLTSFAFLRASAMSASMRDRRSFTAFALDDLAPSVPPSPTQLLQRTSLGSRHPLPLATLPPPSRSRGDPKRLGRCCGSGRRNRKTSRSF